MELKIASLLKDLGVPANLQGYFHLKYAVSLAVEDISITNRITKELYPSVAKKFKTTPARVERAIHHAIEISWGRGNIDTQNKLFGYTVDQGKGKPTNSEFISTVADWLVMTECDGDVNNDR